MKKLLKVIGGTDHAKKTIIIDKTYEDKKIEIAKQFEDMACQVIKMIKLNEIDRVSLGYFLLNQYELGIETHKCLVEGKSVILDFNKETF